MLRALTLPEPLEHGAVVGVAVGADDVGPEEHVADLEERGDILEVVRHLVHAVDEGERPHPRELRRHRLEQRQGERRELRDRTRHVAQDVQVGPRHLRPPEDRVDRHAARSTAIGGRSAGRQVDRDRDAGVDAPSASPAPGRAVGWSRASRPADAARPRGSRSPRSRGDPSIGAASSAPSSSAEPLPGLGGQHLLERVDPGDEVGAGAPLVDAARRRRRPGRRPAPGPSAARARGRAGPGRRDIAPTWRSASRARRSVRRDSSARLAQRVEVAAPEGLDERFEELGRRVRLRCLGRRSGRSRLVSMVRRRRAGSGSPSASPDVDGRAGAVRTGVREMQLEEQVERRSVLGPLDERRRRAPLTARRSARSTWPRAAVASSTSDVETGTPASRSECTRRSSGVSRSGGSPGGIAGHHCGVTRHRGTVHERMGAQRTTTAPMPGLPMTAFDPTRPPAGPARAARHRPRRRRPCHRPGAICATAPGSTSSGWSSARPARRRTLAGGRRSNKRTAIAGSLERASIGLMAGVVPTTPGDADCLAGLAWRWPTPGAWRSPCRPTRTWLAWTVGQPRRRGGRADPTTWPTCPRALAVADDVVLPAWRIRRPRDGRRRGPRRGGRGRARSVRRSASPRSCRSRSGGRRPRPTPESPRIRSSGSSATRPRPASSGRSRSARTGSSRWRTPASPTCAASCPRPSTSTTSSPS